eukprot:UN05130
MFQHLTSTVLQQCCHIYVSASSVSLHRLIYISLKSLFKPQDAHDHG